MGKTDQPGLFDSQVMNAMYENNAARLSHALRSVKTRAQAAGGGLDLQDGFIHGVDAELAQPCGVAGIIHAQQQGTGALVIMCRSKGQRAHQQHKCAEQNLEKPSFAALRVQEDNYSFTTEAQRHREKLDD